jgi:hypothetical protein
VPEARSAPKPRRPPPSALAAVFGGKACRQGRNAPARVAKLARREDALEESVAPARDRLIDPVEIDDIDAVKQPLAGHAYFGAIKGEPTER